MPGMRPPLRRVLVLSGLLLPLLGGAAWLWFGERTYATWESDDGARRFVVRQRLYWSLLPVRPGRSGDGPGAITVYDAHTGRVLVHKRLAHVQVASEGILDATERER